MKERDRSELGITLEDIIKETLLNLAGLEAELQRVKRRLLEHLELADGADGEQSAS